MASTLVNGVYAVACATAEGQSRFRRYHEHGSSQYIPYSRQTIRQVTLITTEYCGRINYFASWAVVRQGVGWSGGEPRAVKPVWPILNYNKIVIAFVYVSCFCTRCFHKINPKGDPINQRVLLFANSFRSHSSTSLRIDQPYELHF